MAAEPTTSNLAAGLLEPIPTLPSAAILTFSEVSILKTRGLDVSAAKVKSELVAEILPLDVDVPVLKSIAGVELLYIVNMFVALLVPIPKFADEFTTKTADPLF